ncbi:hypothetical protein FRC04_010770 [Tulasnella sp. 424]|nr:hypothetical protein FRC04_010770 [Tulasnella sp. 424]KAG8969295.1 hypothetical protein FRC05_001155 [Tulasnella sp. 425]
MDESYIRLPFNRPPTASSSIPEDSEVNTQTASRSNRGKQTSYESVIAFDLAPAAQSPPEDSQHSSAADVDLRPMVDVYKGLTLSDLTDPLPGRAPDYPMHVLMQVAIQSSPFGKLRQCEIRDALIQRFPYFATAGKTWRNTLRHALTNRLSFYKVPKPPSVPGRGAYWSYRFTREPKRKSRPSSSRSNGGSKPGRLRGHSKRGSTFDEDDYEDDDEDDDEEGDEADLAGTVAMTDAPLTSPPLPETNDTMSECFSRPSTSSQGLYQPLALDASMTSSMPAQPFREHRQSSITSTASFAQQPTSANNAAFDIPQVLSPPQITTSQHPQQQTQPLSSAASTSASTLHSIQQQQQFAHQHRPTTTSSLDVPLGILSISSPNSHQSPLSSNNNNSAATPGFEQQDYSYLVPPPNSASSLASVLSGQSSVNGYASTTTPGAAEDANAWLFPETNLFSSFSDDGMFAFSLPMDNNTDPTNGGFYYTAPPQSANSMNPPRCNWSSDSNLSATVFSESVAAVSPPQSRMGSSYGGGPGQLSTHSRPVTSHEPSSGALLSPGLDLRPTSAGSLYGVTLPRPATASFSSAGKDLWSASLHHPLQQSHTAHQQQQQQLHAQQQHQVQSQSHSAIDPVMHSTSQEGSLSMWNAMPASFVGGGFDNNGVQLTGHSAVDAFAHARKWSV